MDDQAELKTGFDAVQCSSKKLDKALLALKVRRHDLAKRIQEDSNGVSLDELNIRLKALHSAFDASNKQGFKEQPGLLLTLKIAAAFAKNPVHVIYRCSDFLSLSAADSSLHKVHALKLCVNCLKFKKHNLSDCTSKGPCHVSCGKDHHSLLHFERPQVANYTASKHNQINETNHIESVGTANHNMSDQAQPKNFAAVKTQHTERNIVATAIVCIILKYNQCLPCRVLLDGGSQINMISERMVHMTGLKRQYAPIQFQCANKTVCGTSNFKRITNLESLLKPFSPQKPQKRVTFSESTLMREFRRRTGQEPTIDPFLNFLTDLRASTNLPQIAMRRWRKMSDAEKAPYKTLAKRAQLKRLQAKQNKGRKEKKKCCCCRAKSLKE
uniref:Peptidase aspartic putative domain-containing protein n=1 Tax=Glossina austeni TaxID=7395 RepID=A0A1A9V5V8_GLOAU